MSKDVDQFLDGFFGPGNNISRAEAETNRELEPIAQTTWTPSCERPRCYRDAWTTE